MRLYISICTRVLMPICMYAAPLIPLRPLTEGLLGRPLGRPSGGSNAGPAD